jgi:hypothetical protein
MFSFPVPTGWTRAAQRCADRFDRHCDLPLPVLIWVLELRSDATEGTRWGCSANVFVSCRSLWDLIRYAPGSKTLFVTCRDDNAASGLSLAVIDLGNADP